MKSLKVNIPLILLIVLEIAVGILLLVNPETFTQAVIIIFGIGLLSVGIIYLLQYLLEKKGDLKSNLLPLIVGAVSIIVGIVCALCSGAIVKLDQAVAIVYGVILAITGVYKLYNFFKSKKNAIAVSKVSILSGLIAIVLGVVIVIYPKQDGMTLSVWQITGIVLIIEAVVDCLSVVQLFKTKKDKSDKDEKKAQKEEQE